MSIKLAALLALGSAQGIATSPPAPPALPPFSPQVGVEVRRLGLHKLAESKRCGAARTNATGRYVEAMNTPAGSSEWQKAAAILRDALAVCRDLRAAMRSQFDYFVDIVWNGSDYDADIARRSLEGMTYELRGIDQFYISEAARLRDLIRSEKVPAS